MPAGPSARLQIAQADFLAAMRGGNASQRFDAQVNLNRAAKALERAAKELRGKTFGDRMDSFLRSSRFGAGPLMPLAGKGMDLAGLPQGGAASTGIMVALVAITTAFNTAKMAVEVFKATVETAGRSLHEASTARMTSGGSVGQVAGLQALGLSGEQIGGLSRSLRQNLSHGMGMLYGQKLGLGVSLPRPFGNPNEAGGLENAVGAIAGLSDESARLTAARALELDSILPLIEAYRRNSAAMQADRKAREGIADAETLKAADDFQNSIGRLKFNFLSLIQAFGKPFLKDMTAMIGMVANTVRGIAAFVNTNPNMITELFAPFKAFLMLIGNIAEGLGKIPKGTVSNIVKEFEAEKARLNSSNSAMQAHTAAMQAHAAVLERQGTFGGGDRVRGALPQHMRGWAFQSAIDGNAMRLGAFAF